MGHNAELVRQALTDVDFVLQEKQLGTGHAVMQAESLLHDRADLVVVTYADMPLLSIETLRRIVETQISNPGPVTMLTVRAENPRGFGRVVRDESGNILGIVEEAQASLDQLQINELNVGVYCFQANWLWNALRRISLSPKGEYYLTDVVGIAVADGLAVQAIMADNQDETIGINTRIHLAEASARMRERINRAWMLSGVTMIDPSAVYIEPDVQIGRDTIIWPNTYLRGRTKIGSYCEIGPSAMIWNTTIGDGCKVQFSTLEDATLDSHVNFGPVARLRKGAHLTPGMPIDAGTVVLGDRSRVRQTKAEKS